MPDDDLERVWELVQREGARSEDASDVVGKLQRLCRAAATALPATGVGVSVMSPRAGQVSVAGSSALNELIEELQFVLGEGPCVDAYNSRGPVLVPDLSVAARTRWPGYAPAAQDHGVQAVFAFPLQVGATRLGALDVYQRSVGSLPAPTMKRALSFAEAALWTLLDAQRDGTAGTGGDHGPDGPGSARSCPAEDTLEASLDLYQAQGMVMIQLGVSLDEAMSRLRAYAYAHDRRLGEVAADVVARRLVMEGETE
jgi:hypothetical protein